MRAKVASRSGGHVFEKRFVEMSQLQLIIAYRQIVREEEQERKKEGGQLEIVKTLHEIWMKRIGRLEDNLSFFNDRELYSHVQEMKEIAKHREEVKPEDFPEIWDEMMEHLPQQIFVEDETPDPGDSYESVNAEMDELITGWYNNSMKYKQEEGE